MKIIIRKATKRDYEKLCVLFYQVDLIHYEKYPDIYKKPEIQMRSIEEIYSKLKDNNQCILVACENERILGLLHGFIYDTPHHPVIVMRKYAKIDGMVVEKENKRKGIGHLLIKHFQKWSKAQGATSIELNVYNFNNEAIKFYKKEGYKDIRQVMRKIIK